MKLPRDQLAQLLAERTLHKTDMKHLATAIAAYLLEERRLPELESLLRDIMQYRLEHGIIEAKVITARELSNAVEQDLATLLRETYPGSQSVRLNLKRDEQLVGGVLVDLPNEQLDATVRGRIATFKRLIAAGV